MEQHAHTNRLVEYLSELRNCSVALNEPISLSQIRIFESAYNLELPVDLISLFCHFNGFAADEMHKLYRIWSVAEFKRITEYFSPTVLYTSGLKFQTLNNRDKSDAFFLVDENYKWQIPEADKYFLFGDYNVNGSYWAIQLRESQQVSHNNIVCIHDSVNAFSNVAGNFSEFLSRLYDTCPENLL